MQRMRMRMENEEERCWVLDYMLLPVVLDVLERDMRIMQTVPLKMPGPYIRSLQQAQDRASAEMAMLRAKMQQRGMRVYEQRRTKERLEADYLCRGYHRTCTMLWAVVKVNTEQKLQLYLGCQTQK